MIQYPIKYTVTCMFVALESQTTDQTAGAEAGEAAMNGRRCSAGEWKSGDNLWLVDLIAPFATPDNKHVEAMLADLIKGPFAGQKFKFHQTDPATGKREVKEIGG